VLEKYIFEEKIGAGNFSVVYRGIERETNQLVAIKSI
jgi:serine/threonine protein kinase